MSSKTQKSNMPRNNQKVEILQYYYIDKLKNSAYNQEINKNLFKIEISLGALLSRKNMAFNQIVNKINKYFLLEFICVILQEQRLWRKKYCNKGSICNIEKMLPAMNIHLKNKK